MKTKYFYETPMVVLELEQKTIEANRSPLMKIKANASL